jgi:2',3'-cyclic-nucleotide 2'-phosphodiesterase (5'-nucleotidase family)
VKGGEEMRKTVLFVLALVLSVALFAQLSGVVTEIDEFYGNVDTDISQKQLESIGAEIGDILLVRLSEHTLELPLVTTYGDVDRGEPLVRLYDGFVRLAVNYGNFASEYSVELGSEVKVWILAKGETDEEKTIPAARLIPNEDTFVLTLLHTNDIHGRVLSFDDMTYGTDVGGLPRIATLVSEIRAENPRTLLLDAGDMFSGTPVSSFFEGQAEFLGALLVGYDAIVIGNHEFDFGHEILQEYVDFLPIPILGGNIVYENGEPFAESHVVFCVDGLRVLVLGLVTTSTPVTTHPKNVVGIEFLDPAEVTRSIMEEEEGNYDLFVVLSHMGYGSDRRLAAEVDGIDVIVGGHSHTKIDRLESVGDTLIAQAYQWGLYLGRIDLWIEDGVFVGGRSELIPVSSDVEENPLVRRLLYELFESRVEEEMARVVGYTPVDLKRGPRGSDSNIGNFVTDAIRWHTEADIAIYNNGGIRTDIPAGEITVGNMYEIEPFGNTIISVELTKEQMIDLFNHMASRGGEPVSGATYVIVGNRAEDIMVDGRPLEDRIYTVATNDFLIAGGDGFEVLTKGANELMYGMVRDAYIAFLDAHPDKVFEIEGRIRTR